MFRDNRKYGWFESKRKYFFPRGGWKRAILYRYHRFRRLPDSPGRISRGAFAGTLVAFTPLFGLHFLIAPLIAYFIGGNILASIAFVGVCNPLTFALIAASSITLGNRLLGTQPLNGPENRDMFIGMGEFFSSIWENLHALIVGNERDWSYFLNFLSELFVPYMIGGTILGLIFGFIIARICHLLIIAYQKRRKASVMKRIQTKE